MKIKSYKIAGGIGMLLSVVLLFLSRYYIESIVEFFRLYVSEDQIVNSFGAQRLEFYISLVIVSFFIFNLFLFFGFISYLIRTLKLEEVFEDIEKVFFKDSLCRLKNIGKYFFITTSVLAVVIHFLVLTFGMPPNDGFIDDNGALLFLISSLLLLVPIFSLRNLKVNRNEKKKMIGWLSALFIIFFFIYGEEVCWGQQYFSIETTGVFKLNYQNENTIHNFFNPLFKYMYPMVAFMSFCMLAYYWFIKTNKQSGIISELIVPHKSFFILFLLMAGSTYSTGTDELFELYLALLSVMYVVRIVLCVKYPSPLLMRNDE